jgi:purine nucleosidase
MAKTRLLIDTDPGVDDALALLMAFSDAQSEVVGLTVTAGNVGLHHTVANTLHLLDVIERDVPVFAGCATPLLHAAADAAFVHGRDGFGDIGAPPSARAPAAEHAVDAILRLTREYPGELTLVMLGPLTNLALALRLDPALPQRVARLVVMGGAVDGRGNIARIPVEFNFGFDPEAAHIVFSGWPQVELVDWQATTAHALPFERFGALLAAGDRRARWYAAISRKTREFMARTPHRGQWVAADALAMALAVRPAAVLEWAERPLAIELDGSLTRGACVVDWDRRGGAADNARILRAFAPQEFAALLARALGNA